MGRAQLAVRLRPRGGVRAERTDKAKLKIRFSVVNLTNQDVLYNFLSTFSGTHFVTPARIKYNSV